MKTEIELAEKWKCDVRTIRRWRKENAPLDDDGAMHNWLSSRRSVPNGTQDALTNRRKRTASVSESANVVSTSHGAAHALTRLAGAEQAAFDSFQKATQTGDVIAIKAARQNWLEISEALRKFDFQVEETERHGEQIARAEVERILSLFSYFWNFGLIVVRDEIVKEFQKGFSGNATKLTDDSLRALWLNTIAISQTKKSIPEWALAAILNLSRFQNPSAEVEKLAALYRQVIAWETEHAATEKK